MVLILLLLFLSVSDLGCFGKLFSETGSWPFIREVCWTRFGLSFSWVSVFGVAGLGSLWDVSVLDMCQGLK